MLHSFLVFLHESVEELIHFQEAANTSHKYFVFPLRNIIFSRSNNNNKNVWTGSLVCVSSFSKISAELLSTHEKKVQCHVNCDEASYQKSCPAQRTIYY